MVGLVPQVRRVQPLVDIATDLTRTDHSVAVVDLDLDVVRFRTGEVQLLDEDELRLHQVELDYPADIIELARRQADDVQARVTIGATPFDGERAAVWQAIIDDHSPMRGAS
jgi:uncharacterized protein